MYITSNSALFHLWSEETLVKHQNFSKNYENDCLQNFLLFFMSLLRAPVVYLSEKDSKTNFETLLIPNLELIEKTGKAVTK